MTITAMMSARMAIVRVFTGPPDELTMVPEILQQALWQTCRAHRRGAGRCRRRWRQLVMNSVRTGARTSAARRGRRLPERAVARSAARLRSACSRRSSIPASRRRPGRARAGRRGWPARPVSCRPGRAGSSPGRGRRRSCVRQHRGIVGKVVDDLGRHPHRGEVERDGVDTAVLCQQSRDLVGFLLLRSPPRCWTRTAARAQSCRGAVRALPHAGRGPRRRSGRTPTRSRRPRRSARRGLRSRARSRMARCHHCRRGPAGRS